MAHWIIEDTKNGIRNYACSHCGHIYYNQLLKPLEWAFCPECFEPINEPYKYMKEKTVVVKDEAVEPTPMKDVVILSIEKYNEIMSDLVKLGEDVEAANRDKEHCLDILKNMGLTEERAKQIVPGTGKFIEDELNPITTRRKIYCSFDVDGDWRE